VQYQLVASLVHPLRVTGFRVPAGVDPWAGAHVVLNRQTVTLGAFEYKPFPLQAEVSLKVGWFFDVQR